MITKRCCRCKKNIDVKLFGKDATGRSKDGFRFRCKPCELLVAAESRRVKAIPCPECSMPMREASKLCRACWQMRQLTQAEKICACCEVQLPLSQFGIRPGTIIEKRPRAWRKTCESTAGKEYRKNMPTAQREEMLRKSREYSKVWIRDNPHKVRLWRVKRNLRKWGMRDEAEITKAAMRLAEIKMCMVCGGTTSRGALHIDHCHRTNEVRGVLCSNCNFGLGSFKDSVSILLKAVLYLGCSYLKNKVKKGNQR